MECVAINLTLVYAMLAYSSIKKQDTPDNQVSAWLRGVEGGEQLGMLFINKAMFLYRKK